MSNYEAPDVMEIGEAQELTLGTAGSSSDDCNCSLSLEGDAF